MREILFRGKCVDNGGEWAVGAGILQAKNHTYVFVCAGAPCNRDYYATLEVIPETIGQYTGLTDKNGNKIFEGDIVKYIIDKGEYEFAEFEYGNIIFLNGGFQIAGKPCDLCVCSFDTKDFDLEVIGNIHDNPELLKERKNG